MKKIWKFKEYDDSIIEDIVSNFKISPIVARVLYNRGLQNIDDIRRFLSYNEMTFYSPFLFKDADKAVNLIKETVDRGEKIAIFGDYDVDGITSVAILHEFFNDQLDYDNVEYILPEREIGYGLNNAFIERIIRKGVSLLITVDCGICNVDEIRLARENGIRVIITDHHEIPEEKPEAEAVLNPKLPDQYPIDFLAGVGVAFKLIQACLERLELDKSFIDNIIDLVALGTIADIVPVLDENRLITKLGLDKMKKHKRPGIEAIMKYVYGDDINSRTISFGIAPRINASGRIGDPQVALDLLVTKDKNKAKTLAKELDDQNHERQSIESGIMKKADKLVQVNELNKKVIMISSYDWNIGVIGVVSSKLKDNYFRPAFLISIDKESGMGKGSARSIHGFHLVNSLNQCSDLLVEYGGHEFAAGFTIKEENIPEFHRRLVQIFEEEKAKGDGKGPVIDIDMEVHPRDVNMHLYDELRQRLYPFGEKNPFPKFAIKNITVKNLHVFSGRHLSLWLTDGFHNIKSVCYNFLKENQIPPFDRGDMIDIAFTIKLTHFRNESFIEMQLLDINFSEKEKKAKKKKSFNINRLREKGNEFLFTGSYDRAISFYRKALKGNEQDYRILFNIGLAYRKKGDKGKALSFFNKAKRFAKDNDEKVYDKINKNLKKLRSGD